MGDVHLAAACAVTALRAESPSLGCHSPAQNPFIEITRNNKSEIKLIFVSTLSIVKCHRLEMIYVLMSVDYW